MSGMEKTDGLRPRILRAATAEELDLAIAALGVRGKMERTDVVATVQGILDDVRAHGDAALCTYTARFDKVTVGAVDLRVTPAEFEAAFEAVDPDLLAVMERAAANILAFHERQRETGFETESSPGARVGVRVTPLATAGIYVPGGTAPLPSSVLMNAIPAKAAGVDRLVMCTPPRIDGSVAPVILAAARLAGVDEVYRVGGAQAVAAMAYGTATVPRVDKICGPGNLWVNTAKRLVYGQVDIDMFAGPSEILIVADGTADPAFVAADLLSQAEHDVLSSAIVVTTDATLAEAVADETARRAALLPRLAILERSLADYAGIVVVPDLAAAVDFANRLAPEHLELCVADPDALLPRIRNAGAIFVGPYSPEPLGDYYAGPNHVLPTSGTARFFSPLSTQDFQKRTSVLRYTREALERSASDIAAFADAEGLAAHADAIRVRFGTDRARRPERPDGPASAPGPSGEARP